MTCWPERASVRARERERVGGVHVSPGGQVGDRCALSLRVLANGLYRRRARDWDPGFRMRGSLSRISTQAPRARRLSSLRADSPRLSLSSLLNAPVLACLAPAYLRGADGNLPPTCPPRLSLPAPSFPGPPLPTPCLPYLLRPCPYLPLRLPIPVCPDI